MELPATGLRRSNVPEVVWPPIVLGANAVLVALIDQLRATERLSLAAIEDFQGQQLARLCAHHQAVTPSFAARLRAAGLERLESLSDLARLSPISRREAQAAGEAFFAMRTPDSHGQISQINTSGSTGEPVSVRKTQLQTLLWLAVTMRDLLWHGHDFTQRISSIRPGIENYEKVGWGRPVDDLYVSGPAQGISIGTDIAEQQRLIGAFGPQVLVTIPGNLRGLTELWEAGGGPPPSLRRIRTLGETVHDELREQVQRVTGVTLEDTYSTQEAGSLAIQCPESGLYHVMAETVIVEVLGEDGDRCAEGRSGRVVVTDLHNLATPLVRYETGDWAEVGGPCRCGRGLPTLRRILGRERNLITLPDGRRHWPLIGTLGRAFQKIAPVRQFQVIQHRLDSLEVRHFSDRPISESERAAMTEAVAQVFHHPFAVDYVPCDGPLPRGPNGKFEDFVSRL